MYVDSIFAAYPITKWLRRWALMKENIVWFMPKYVCDSEFSTVVTRKKLSLALIE